MIEPIMMPIYAREGIPYAWLLDPVLKTLEVFGLSERIWMLTGVYRGDARVKAKPFDAIELDLTCCGRSRS